MPWYQRELCHHAQLASERGQREHVHLAERHSAMLRELHEAAAAAAALKAGSAEQLKQLQLKEDALKAARSDVAKVTPVLMAECSSTLGCRSFQSTRVRQNFYEPSLSVYQLKGSHASKFTLLPCAYCIM